MVPLRASLSWATFDASWSLSLSVWWAAVFCFADLTVLFVIACVSFALVEKPCMMLR
jgi:hypothetical protein